METPTPTPISVTIIGTISTNNITGSLSGDVINGSLDILNLDIN